MEEHRIEEPCATDENIAGVEEGLIENREWKEEKWEETRI